MESEPIAVQLGRFPHFRGLAEDLLDRVAQSTRIRPYRTGEEIFRQGEKARAFFLVRAGGVKVYRLSPDGREQVLHHVHAGQSFAEAALLSLGRFPAHAQATVASTELFEIGGEEFLQLFKSEPRLSAAMVSSLCIWMHELVERIEELSVARASARLARYLLRLPAHGEGHALSIDLPLSRKELAAHLAIVPETLSRLLRRWEDDGVVIPKGRVPSIPDSRTLIGIADREED